VVPCPALRAKFILIYGESLLIMEDEVLQTPTRAPHLDLEDFRSPDPVRHPWLNVGATRILESISSPIEWCPSGMCWIMIL